MMSPDRPNGPSLIPPLQPPRDSGGSAVVQKELRTLMVALNAAVRAIKLYPVENVAVLRALADLDAANQAMLVRDGESSLHLAGDTLVINEIRLRLSLDNYAAVASLTGLFRASGLGELNIVARPDSRAWILLLSFLQAPPVDVPEEDRLAQLSERLSQAGVNCFVLQPPTETGSGEATATDAAERARQTYARSIGVTRELMTSARLGRNPGLRKVKRAVQSIVDAILADPTSLVGLTTLRDFDEYTFVHSVNVCILSVAIGRKLGFTRPQLLDLGMAALLFDFGKSRLPLDLLNKRGKLDDNERAMLQTHTWQGVLSLAALQGTAARPWRAMTAAYEHHMRTDLSGYPTCKRPRVLSLFSKIIAVTDGFDAATTSRVFRDHPWTPADVLRGMRDNQRLGFDPVVVKALINLTGIYPAGTVVVLDTFEIGLVVRPNPDPTALTRPMLRLLIDERGNTLSDTALIDLAARDSSGQYLRSIIRTEDPHRYGLNIGDFFV